MGAAPAVALDRLCDPAVEDCRTQLLSLINNEQVGIDVAFWFMEDSRYVDALRARRNAGVPVRVLMDPRGNNSSQYNAGILQALANAGIPMRMRTASGILHWKMMLFAGQGVVEFSGANYSAFAWVPVSPYSNYVDEAIYFTDDTEIFASFFTEFDASWVDTVHFANYANVTGPPTRRYPVYPIAKEMNFPPAQSYANRAINLYNHENVGIDAIMYRITQRTHTDAIIAARQRGVPVRLITEQNEYRDPARLWDSWNVDRLWAAGVQIRIRAHAGLIHQKTVILHGLQRVIFGSSNWTSPSDNSQQEHNYFLSAAKPEMIAWFIGQFERKWTNGNPIGAYETMPFAPLPPDVPKNNAPANGAFNQPRTITLRWYAGPWAHNYDIYFGTSNPPPLFIANVSLGPSQSSSDYKTFTVSGLAATTTYFWRIVSKTMAGQTATGAVSGLDTGF
jgi:hypothetical protein